MTAEIKCTGDASIPRRLSLFGVAQNEADREMAQFGRTFADVAWRLCPDPPEIHIDLDLSGCGAGERGALGERAVAWLSGRFGAQVLPPAADSMPATVGRLLLRREETIAVAESCTGGLISDWLTNVAGSSGYFLFGGVTYANQAKVNVLGVSPDTLQHFGAVHEETAREMAAGVRRLAGATYGLATSGIAGPDGGTRDKPVGTVCVALATPQTVLARRFVQDCGDRLKNKKYFALAALGLLRDLLQAGQ